MSEKSGTVFDSEGRDQKGFTRLHWACFEGNVEAVRGLLHLAHDRQNLPKQTTLMWACLSGNIEICHMLLKANVELDAVDEYGYTAASHAVQSGHLSCLHMLLELGANVHVRDKDLHTLLHWAAFYGNLRITVYLLKRGVPIGGVDANGATALHWAAIRGHTALISTLLEHGADGYAKDAQGKTPADVAESFPRCLKELATPVLTEQQRESRRQWYWWGGFLGASLIWCLVGWLGPWWALVYVVAVVLGLRDGRAALHFGGHGGFRSGLAFGLMCATCAGIYYYHIFYLMPGLPQFNVLHMIWHALMIVMFVFLFYVKRDPGLVPKNVSWDATLGSPFCPFCMSRSPERSHHCRRCDVCVSRFDHHCPWLDVCVGSVNGRFFVGLLLTAVTCHIVWLWQCYVFFSTQSVPFDEFWSAYGPFVVFFVFEVLQCCGEALLLSEQLFNVLIDQTTWERMHGRKKTFFEVQNKLQNLRDFFLDPK